MPENLDKILRIKTERLLRNDFTVIHNKKLYQIEDKITSKKVIMEEKADGSLLITYNGKQLTYKEITIRPERSQKTLINDFNALKKYKHPKDHPWKKFSFGRYNKSVAIQQTTGLTNAMEERLI